VQTPEDALKAASCIREMGAKVVIISLGKLGAVLSTDQQSWLALSPLIEESNPIGAGDALVGGLVWALNMGYTMDEALHWGVACGAASASLDGTAVGGREFVRSLYEQVTISALG
jgi:fructose-1-phosphate kinase PfkB-like protein